MIPSRVSIAFLTSLLQKGTEVGRATSKRFLMETMGVSSGLALGGMEDTGMKRNERRRPSGLIKPIYNKFRLSRRSQMKITPEKFTRQCAGTISPRAMSLKLEEATGVKFQGKYTVYERCHKSNS